MKGSISVDPIFSPFPHVKRATVYHRNPVVALDHYRLYLGPFQSSRHKNLMPHQNVQSTETVQMASIPWSMGRSIINATVSKQYRVLMLLCDDWKLYIYNENLDQITKLINWESKYTVGFELIESLNTLLMIGVGEVELLKLNLNTNIKKTKFLSSVKFSIEKKKILREDPKTKLKWNKGYGYDLEDNLLFLWSLQDINFYSLNKLELKSEIRSLVKKQEPITFTYYNQSYKYTVTGLYNGNVRVWRLPFTVSATHTHSSLTASNEYIMIHNCIRHSKPIEKIVASNDDRIILSQSGEPMVCMWSLETFELLRVYDFEGEYSKVFLTDYHGALAVRDYKLGLLTFGKTMEFILELSNAIVQHDKTYSAVTPPQKGTPFERVEEIQLTLSSNMGLQISSDSLKIKDLNKVQAQHFYPPLKSQEIKQVISCPFKVNRYYLLSEIGKIYKVRMEGNNSIFEHCYSINMTPDIENHPLNQLPTLIKFCRIIPTEFDSEIIEAAIVEGQEKERQRQSRVVESVQEAQSPTDQRGKSLQERFLDMKLITVGCNKGSIVFLPVENMDRVFTRITYHRDEITMIETVYSRELNNSILVSVCREGLLKMVKFQDNKAFCFQSISLHSRLSFLKGFDDRLAIVLWKGLFEIMSFGKESTTNPLSSGEDQNNEQQLSLKPLSSSISAQNHEPTLFCIQNFDVIDHEGQIQSLDIEYRNKIVLTAASDNKIKIWTYNKIQLYEIFLDEGLKYSVFSNDFQILVAHNQKLLYLRGLPFSVTEKQVQEYNSEFLNQNSEILLAEDFIKSGTKPEKTQARHSIKQQLFMKSPLKAKDQLTDINIEYEEIMRKNEKREKLSAKKPQQKQSSSRAHNYSKLSSHSSAKKSAMKRLSLMDDHKFMQVSKSSFTQAKDRSQSKARDSLASNNRKRIQSTLNRRTPGLSFESQGGANYSQSVMGFTENLDASITKKHLEEMDSLKKQVNQPLLPKIKAHKEDIFDEFMKDKLLNKKVLTRRDITLNRIIMKNIIKDSLGDQSMGGTSSSMSIMDPTLGAGFKLDF